MPFFRFSERQRKPVLRFSSVIHKPLLPGYSKNVAVEPFSSRIEIWRFEGRAIWEDAWRREIRLFRVRAYTWPRSLAPTRLTPSRDTRSSVVAVLSTSTLAFPWSAYFVSCQRLVRYFAKLSHPNEIFLIPIVAGIKTRDIWRYRRTKW